MQLSPAPANVPGSTGSTLRNIDQLPGPRGWPLLGSLMQIDRARVHQTVEGWTREYGPFFRFRLGASQFLAVGDHEALGAILRDRPDGFRRTPRLEVVWREMGLAPGVFGANGDAWRHQRRMVMAGFDPAHVRAYFPSLLKVTQRLRGRWHKAAQAGAAIDLQGDLMRFTVDAIAGLAFGSDINTLESDEDVIQRHLDKIFPAVAKRMLSQWSYWNYFMLPSDRRLARSVREVNVAVHRFIAQARERMVADPSLREHPNNLLEAMIAAADLGDSGVDDRDVAGNVLTLLLAGEDTTANTLAWMIDLLWQHPQALARATEEVRRVTSPTEAPTLEQLSALDYIEACAHETMRLRPVAPLIAVQALRDTVVGDVAITKGTVVINVMRHDSVSDRHVPNAAAFEPERWLADGQPGTAAASAKRTSMPFGAGPRICPGRYMALLEMKLAMATLLGRFDITAVDTEDGLPAREVLKFAMAPMGLRMKLRERSV